MFALFSWFGCYLVMHECDYCFLTRIQLLYCRLFLGLRNKREKQLLIRNSKYTVSSRKKRKCLHLRDRTGWKNRHHTKLKAVSAQTKMTDHNESLVRPAASFRREYPCCYVTVWWNDLSITDGRLDSSESNDHRCNYSKKFKEAVKHVKHGQN